LIYSFYGYNNSVVAKRAALARSKAVVVEEIKETPKA
jgi:hypothetical protein